MTVYEAFEQKKTDLQQAFLSCVEEKNWQMAYIWALAIVDLEKIQDELPVFLAQKMFEFQAN